MSDPPKVIIKPSKTESTENGGPSCSTSPPPTIRTSEPEALQASSSFLRRHLSKRFSRSSSQRSDANVEAIILEETSGPKRQPVTLKASFLRRKIEEYEGKKLRWLIKVSFKFVISNNGLNSICWLCFGVNHLKSTKNWHCRKKVAQFCYNLMRTTVSHRFQAAICIWDFAFFLSWSKRIMKLTENWQSVKFLLTLKKNYNLPPILSRII